MTVRLPYTAKGPMGWQPCNAPLQPGLSTASPKDLLSFVMKKESSPSLLGFWGLGMQAPPVSTCSSGPLRQHKGSMIKCAAITNRIYDRENEQLMIMHDCAPATRVCKPRPAAWLAVSG